MVRGDRAELVDAVEPAAWEQAWTGGRRCVHLGNVADFNAQFLDPGLFASPLLPGSPLPGSLLSGLRTASGALRRWAGSPNGRQVLLDWPGQGHQYAALTPFYSPHPAVVVLPRHLEPAWLDVLTRPLEWDPVEVHSGIAEQAWFWPALTARPALLGRLRERGLPLVPWGRSPGEALSKGQGGAEVSALVRRFESKRAALELFRATAADAHPEVPVRRARWLDTPRALTRAIGRAAARGETVVLKAEYGVAGLGTAVVTPGQVAAAGGARALLDALMAQDPLIRDRGGMLLEPYVTGAARLRDLTFDAVVAPDGHVHPVGVAVMHVAGTGYQGATVGPGLVPAELAERATRFGLDVGRRLAGLGYRGWYDIDFVAGPDGTLAPMETNLRLTGPAIAFMIKARLDHVRGPGHVVRILDELPLGARLAQEHLFDHLARLARRCERHGALLLPTLPDTAFDPVPSVGVAIAARSRAVVDTAEALVRAANADLGRLFTGLSH